MERFFTMLRFVQNDRVLVCSHGLKIRAIGMRYEIRVTRCEYFYHKVHWDGVKWLRFWAHWGTSEMFWMRDEGWGVKSWSWWVVKGCEMQDGVYAYRKEPFPLWRDSSLCCASFRMTRFCFLLTIRNLNYFWNAKIFFILIMFLKEQSWRNSFALKQGGKWCGMMW